MLARFFFVLDSVHKEKKKKQKNFQEDTKKDKLRSTRQNILQNLYSENNGIVMNRQTESSE